MSNNTLTKIQEVLQAMKEKNDDISIANITAYLDSGHKVEHIIRAEDEGSSIVFYSDEVSCVTCHHIDSEQVIGFSHVSFK